MRPAAPQDLLDGALTALDNRAHDLAAEVGAARRLIAVLSDGVTRAEARGAAVAGELRALASEFAVLQAKAVDLYASLVAAARLVGAQLCREPVEDD